VAVPVGLLAVVLAAGAAAPAPAAGAATPTPAAAAAAPAAAAGTPPAAAAPPPRPAPIVHVIDEKERVALLQTDNVRLSLPTQSDRDAWHNPGLRVAIGYGYGIVKGSGPAASFRSQTVLLRPSVRLDRQWALGVAMLYGVAPQGVRWSVTAEPTFFPWRELAVSVGIGYGGLLTNNPNASNGTLQGSAETVSRNLVDGERLNSCSGSALISSLRAEYLFVAGSLFASGPFAQANAQWTQCQETFGRTDNETGRPVVLTQWWQQQGATFGWWFAWR
jgi:hypothetical protein